VAHHIEVAVGRQVHCTILGQGGSKTNRPWHYSTNDQRVQL
jgi:hypothetical protein